MSRKRVFATFRVWHTDGGSTALHTDSGDMIGDVRSVDVTLLGVPWLHGVKIDVDPKTGEVEITVIPEDENSPTAPRLTVSPDLSMTART